MSAPTFFLVSAIVVAVYVLGLWIAGKAVKAKERQWWRELRAKSPPPEPAVPSTDDFVPGDGEIAEWVALWRRLIVGEGKSWVLFSHGTCVVFAEKRADLEEAAVALLREWGPVHVGSASADFNVVRLDDAPGRVVGCHHPDILAHVEGTSTPVSDAAVGLVGRATRDMDAANPVVVHVERAP